MAKTEKTNSGSKPQVEVKKYKCSCCPEEYKDQEKNFYKSSSLTMRGNNGRMVVCKKCVLELFALLLNKYENAELEPIKLSNIKKSEPILNFENKKYNDEIKKCLRIWPQDNDTEGFFVAKIRKS